MKQKRVSGLYALTPDEPDTAALLAKVREAIAGGARLVQYRNKRATPELARLQVLALLAPCHDAGVPLIVNDALDIALELGADGVHLGAGDGDAAAARRRLPAGSLLGVSCYNRAAPAREAAAAGADYVAFGSFFRSSTKPGAVPAELALIGAAKRDTGLPVVAIGGITPENAAALVAAGADAVAVISALFDAPDVRAAARRFSRLFPESTHAEPT